MPLDCALQTFIQGYISFLLTIGCSIVAIYTTSNDVLKIFDSHATILAKIIGTTGVQLIRTSNLFL